MNNFEIDHAGNSAQIMLTFRIMRKRNYMHAHNVTLTNHDWDMKSRLFFYSWFKPRRIKITNNMPTTWNFRTSNNPLKESENLRSFTFEYSAYLLVVINIAKVGVSFLSFCARCKYLRYTHANSILVYL